MRKQSERSFKWSQVSAFRYTRHQFVDRHSADLVTVSRDVCGIQYQVMAAAEMALWVRVRGLTQADIQSALWKNRTLVKTSAMRSTLHLLPATDFPIYISALKASRLRQMRRIMARYGVAENEADRVTQGVEEALSAGPMTRSELTDQILSLKVVGKKAKKWFELSWWGVVRQGLVEGLICYGPDRGQEATLVRVDQWLPGQREAAELDARQIVLRRYLSAYGPATPQDFSKWSGFSIKEVRAVWSHWRKNWLKSSSRIRKDGFSAKIFSNFQRPIWVIKFCVYYQVLIPICLVMWRELI